MPVELSAREAAVMYARREAEKLKGRRVTLEAVLDVMKRGYRYRQLDFGTDDLMAVERALDRLIKEGRAAREWSSVNGEWLYRKVCRKGRT